MESIKEMSKTYQYRKVMKPMLERKRRARINKCLDELKDLMIETMRQQSGDNVAARLEKADILELTVEHLRKIKSSNELKKSSSTRTVESFRAGYVNAANEVSRCLASLPKIDIALGTTLMTHLGHRLNQIQGTMEQTTTAAPLTVNCETKEWRSGMLSPASSGYGSDTEITSSPISSNRLLLRPVASAQQQIWRPW